jgi:C-terminal processing protease CtpA/Prc
MSGLDFKQDGMEWTKDMVTLSTKNKENTSSGVEVINNSLQYNFVLKPIFSIAGVRKDSPGAKSGLQKDDRLITINGRKTADMTLQKIMEMMKSEEGKTIEILIERKNKQMTLSFTLEDPIPYQD